MSTTSRQQSPFSLLFLFFFGIPFLMAGLLVAGFGVTQILDYQRSESWVTVPARFQQVHVTSRRGSKGGTFYSLEAQYAYDYQGKSYKNSRIFFQDASKRDPTRFTDLERKIKEGMQRDRSYPVLVDPQDPEQAVVIRENSIELWLPILGGGIFLAVGGAMMVFGLYSFLNARRRSNALALDPNRPWKAEEQWKGFSLTSHGTGKVLGMWGVALFMNVFISAFLIALSTDRSAPLFAWVIIGFFALVAIGLLISAIYLTLQHLKYGKTTLLLSQMPLAIGQEFSVVIVVGRHLEMEKGCTVSLKCKRLHTTGS